MNLSSSTSSPRKSKKKDFLEKPKRTSIPRKVTRYDKFEAGNMDQCKSIVPKEIFKHELIYIFLKKLEKT